MGQGLCSLVAGVFSRANVRRSISSIAIIRLSPTRGDCSTHEGSVKPSYCLRGRPCLNREATTFGRLEATGQR